MFDLTNSCQAKHILPRCLVKAVNQRAIFVVKVDVPGNIPMILIAHRLNNAK